MKLLINEEILNGNICYITEKPFEYNISKICICNSIYIKGVADMKSFEYDPQAVKPYTLKLQNLEAIKPIYLQDKPPEEWCYVRDDVLCNSL